MSETKRTAKTAEWKAIDATIARLRASVMATVFGVLGGGGLFVATVWLLIRGPAPGQKVGTNLGLLSNYFPGYDVTWFGAVIGLVYGAITGGVIGWAIAWLYNVIAAKRHGPA